MTGLLALTTLATYALIAAILVGLAFAGGLIVLAMRRREGPDIPPGMRPGPADDVLERRHVERIMGWGIVFVVITALWLPVLWLREPDQNVADAVELQHRAEERGEQWFGIYDSASNPLGFGCARCHGTEAEGGSVPFTNPQTGEFNPAYPVPPLNNVCGRLPVDATDDLPVSIRDTIMQGREGTPMPSWSVRFAGPMNDQQITDLISHIVKIQTIPEEENLCLNPSAGAEEPETEASPGVPASEVPAEEEASPEAAGEEAA